MTRPLRLASTGGATTTYVDDVFATYLYAGNSSTQTITNGIDLAGNGGLVWLKGRTSNGYSHVLSDTARGISNALITDSANGQYSNPTGITSVASNGFTLGSASGTNGTIGGNYVSWTFRKAPKFFDVVTYTGDGVAGRQIPHSLGSVPGMIIVKRTDAVSAWAGYHKDVGINFNLDISSTNGSTFVNGLWNAAPTVSVFNVSASGIVNANGGTYVAYLFAHDTAADGLIQCGSYSGTGGFNNNVTLGWEAQFVLIKRTDTSPYDWFIFDTMRGMIADAATQRLLANTSGAEASFTGVAPTATGFKLEGGNASVNASGATYIYIAIRRPNKPPTSGTQVYNAIARTGTGAAATVTGVGFTPDLDITCDRSSGTRQGAFFDRLRGADVRLASYATAGEISGQSELTTFGMDGASFGTSTGAWTNVSATTYINYFFRRAPGFFDVVTYTGTGTARTVNHNLGVAPELMIVKPRTTSTLDNAWAVWDTTCGTTKHLFLNTTGAQTTSSNSLYFNSTNPTASVFSVGSWYSESAVTYVAYLFAPLPGISKVGSYTGNGGTVNTNGTSQTINCGFSAGARFVLIKRTDSTGDWYVFDSARGIVAGNDPYLLLNSTAAEATTVDAVDADNSGFIVNQTSGTNLNVTNATYIYLAIA